ncbi:YebC/PmpR family DNA-binding transcriptional regulator [Candidatus Saccharibacteria bacterium CPR2]|nr:YebC/PmpR family DNA-binding transcriptional regulator [Candidatus Saccharibacteria bacterium CPR2]
MSGHSKWATIKRKKGVTDAKRGQLFTKLGNAIAIAAKSGGNPDLNPTLALAIEKAKTANMPNVNIERSIKRGTGELGGAQIQEMTYEGYGPGGIAVIVQCASDNKNRTYSDVRTVFSKNGGNIAETGAVAFQFERKGVVRIKVTNGMDEAILSALDSGADDANEEDGELIVYTEGKALAKVRDGLKATGLEVLEASLSYVPKNIVTINDKGIAEKVMRLMNALDDLDDVTEVYSNFDIIDG